LKKKLPEVVQSIQKAENDLPEDRNEKVEEALAKVKDVVDKEEKAVRDVLKNPND